MATNKVVLNNIEYDIDTIINGKGRGIHEVINKDKLIVTENTITTTKTDSVIVYPSGDSYLVLIKPDIDFKQNQEVTIISKYVLKKLSEAKTLVSNTPGYYNEGARDNSRRNSNNYRFSR